jgi:hypothetical protein
LVTRMADSVQPWRIPEVFRQLPNGVAAYADGGYKWTQEWYDSFPRRISIATVPGPDAVHARCCDVERGDFTPEMVPAFYEGRKQLLGDQADVVVYADRSTVPLVLEATDAAGIPRGCLLWWIATLDNQPWTQQGLSQDLVTRFGAVLVQPPQIWACQWQPMGGYDVSFVFGDPQWV